MLQLLHVPVESKAEAKAVRPPFYVYLVAICVVLLKIFTTIFMIQIHETQKILLRFLPGLFELNLGLI